MLYIPILEKRLIVLTILCWSLSCRLLVLVDLYLKWLESFVVQRSQIVKFNDCFSRVIEVSSGVPQGSHLGPLIFNLFINDIKNVFRNCKFLLYADDLKIFRRIDSPADAYGMQLDLLRLSSWSSANNLHFNLSKCQVIRFSRKRNLCK